MPGSPRTAPATWEPSPATPAADADLVARAQRERQAFELLYRRYLDPVHRYCYRRLGSREAAEDATSLVFAKALASLPAYRDGSFRSWLFAIAHHVVADSYRAWHPASPLEVAVGLPDRGASPEEQALAADGERSVLRLLAQLPPDQRRVVELRLAGLTGREVAAVLGKSLPAGKSAQVRAYARLRDLLGVPAGAHGGGDGGR